MSSIARTFSRLDTGRVCRYTLGHDHATATVRGDPGDPRPMGTSPGLPILVGVAVSMGAPYRHSRPRRHPGDHLPTLSTGRPVPSHHVPPMGSRMARVALDRAGSDSLPTPAAPPPPGGPNLGGWAGRPPDKQSDQTVWTISLSKQYGQTVWANSLTGGGVGSDSPGGSSPCGAHVSLHSHGGG